MSIKLGCHVSMSGGLLGAAKEAASYKADTFMMYTGAPQNTKRKPLDQLKIDEGKGFMAENNLSDIVVHAPYIINMASYKDTIYDLAKTFFAEEIRRTEAIGANYIVVHPGAYTDKDADFGIRRIVDALNEILTPETKPTICLETMAGKGTEIGRSFEEIGRIIEGVSLSHKIGVCFDTCHTHDHGYDIVNDFDGVMQDFEAHVGIERIKVFHINGSLNPRGGKKDRHANIGADHDNPRGFDHIGRQALYKIVHHPAAQGKPLILETPWLNKSTNLYKEEIAYLRGTNND